MLQAKPIFKALLIFMLFVCLHHL